MFQYDGCRSSKHRKTPSSINAYPYFMPHLPLPHEPHSHQPHGLSVLFSRQELWWESRVFSAITDLSSRSANQ